MKVIEMFGGFSSYLAVLSVRGKFLFFTSLLFFGCVFTAALAAEFLLPPPLYSDLRIIVPEVFRNGSLHMLLFGVFIFNLVASVFVSLSGFVFFPFSFGLLVYRAYVWGLILNAQPIWLFLVALPTLVFEGLGYVFACVAGTIVGVSWIMPRWLYKEKAHVRIEALRRALEEFLAIYVFAVILLFVGAVTGAVTLMMT